VFDLVCVGITFYYVRKIFIELGFKGNDASLGTFLVFSLPVFFGVGNPWYSLVYSANFSSETFSWVTLPEAFFPAFYRTPEPQFSWMLVSVVSYTSLRKKTFLPLYLAIPFLLEFVRIPLLFIVLSLHLSMLNEKRKLLDFRYAQMLIGIIVFAFISLLILIYYKIWIEGSILDVYLTKSHLPLISGSSVITFLILFIGKRFLRDDDRRLVCLAAAATMVALNTQIISGIMAPPANFEQYFGVIILVFVATYMVLSVKIITGFKYCLAIAGFALMILYTKTIFQIHSDPIFTNELPEELVVNLRNNSSRVILDNVHLASTLGMVLPRQHLTGISYNQSFAFAAGKYFNNYLCVKEKIRSNEELSSRYAAAFKTLDHAYKYQNSDFVNLHVNRKTNFKVFFDPDKKPENCEATPLFFYPAGKQ